MIPVEAFQNFDEEQAVNIISNTFTDFKEGAAAINIQPIFNPIQFKTTPRKKIALYERMLKEKDDMMSKLEKLI